MVSLYMLYLYNVKNKSRAKILQKTVFDEKEDFKNKKSEWQTRMKPGELATEQVSTWLYYY